MSDPRYENTGDPITRAIEECAELIHILCKVKRFGWNNYHPGDPKQTPNWKLAHMEIEDVERTIAVLKKQIGDDVIDEKVKDAIKQYNQEQPAGTSITSITCSIEGCKSEAVVFGAKGRFCMFHATN
jgi:benzoyl-CoA reductase/2-hydroxyglutaryl-CoA dehydratase subunit BcrC/BadD/HgdB